MSEAQGSMVFHTRTDSATLLRNLAAFVEDLEWQGIASRVTVTLAAGAEEPESAGPHVLHVNGNGQAMPFWVGRTP